MPVTMKQLLLLLFFPMAVFGQTTNAGRSINGPSTNRPVCSRDANDSNAHNGDVYSDTDDGNAYKCLDGAWRPFGAGTTSPVNPANPSDRSTRESEVESIAQVDIRVHGAYAKFSSTTCSTRNGSFRVTLGAASNFKNGEYATCYNAGAATTATGQSMPTVTPGVHDGGMTITPGGGRSTSYAYKIVGEDAYNGRSAASPAGATSTGAAALGKVGSTFKDCTRSNQIVTCATGSPHMFIPGMQIWVAGMTDPTFNGNWVTIFPTSGSSVTWKSGWDTRNGASTFSTVTGTVLGYNVWGWLLNRISWPHDSTSYRHHVYGPNCPTTCNWMGQTMLDYWDDYGFTGMGANQTQPPYIPTVAPSSATNQHFTFQIVSGGGATTLMANVRAGASVTAKTIVSDVGPALTAACTAAKTSGTGTLSNVFIANMDITWQVNSYTNLYKKNCSILLNGSNLSLNQPIDNAASIIGTGSGNVGSFGWSPSPVIGGGLAYPLIAQTGGAGTVPILKNLSIFPNQSNGGLAIYLNTPTNIDWDTIFIQSSPGSTSDCTGQGVVIQNFATGFFWNINKFTFHGGACEVSGQQYTGDSPVPFFISTGPSSGVGAGSGLYMKQGWMVNRGGVNLDLPSTSSIGAVQISMERVWTQSNTVPAISWSGPYTGLSSQIRLVDIWGADFATPQFVNYANVQGTIIVQNVSPYGGISAFGGNPITGVSMQNVNAAFAGTNSQSFNQVASQFVLDGFYNSTPGSMAVSQMNEEFLLGNGYPFVSGTTQPAAPTCSVTTAGPPYTAAGSYTFAYGVAYPPSNGVGQLSPRSSSCTANGTSQQITINIPEAVPGASGYTIWGKSMLTCSSPTTTTLRYTWTGSACGPSPPSIAGGGPAGIQGMNAWATNFAMGATVAPTGATNTTYLYMDNRTLWPAFKPNGNRDYVIPGISGPITDGHSLCSTGTRGAYIDCQTTRTIAVGTSTLRTTLIAPKTCSNVVITEAAGVITTDVISYSFNAAPSGAFTTGLVIQSYVTPGNVNFLVCNTTENSLLPPAATLNWRVVR